MKEVFRDSRNVIYETEKGNIVSICRDSSFKNYYHVVVRRPDEKGQTIKTAFAVAKEY